MLSVEAITEVISRHISNNLRSGEEVFDFILESGYELLPYPVRLVVKKEIFTQFCINRKTDIINAIWVECSGCGAEKVKLNKCEYCAKRL